MTLTITEAAFEAFAPQAKAVYWRTLKDHLNVLKDAGILENKFRLAHFMGQCYAETGGFTVLRESLAYRSPARLRAVWPSRFGKKSDAELAPLIADQVLMADAVYGGRMGNRKGTEDGYDYRGGYWLQTTGKSAVEKYCKQLGAVPSPKSLDDPVLTLQMACLEWEQSGCNTWADQNDVLKVSKAINTGSATSKVVPVGMEHRKAALARALKAWGNAEHLAVVADVKPADLDSRTIKDATLLQRGAEVTTIGAVIKGVSDANAPAPPPPPQLPSLPEIADGLSVTQKIMDGVAAVSKFAVANYWIAVIVIALLVWFKGRRIIASYLEDIRTGKRQPVFKVTKAILERVAQ